MRLKTCLTLVYHESLGESIINEIECPKKCEAIFCNHITIQDGQQDLRDLFFAYKTAKSTYLDFELESPKIVGPSLPHDRSGKKVLLGNSSCLRPLAWLVLFLVMFLSSL